ncbi:MAG TPA: nucleoside/nucleotide kinase family protein [Devosiaceae bacterium]|jgi:pantothenate kinase|nr:nucleoside/nucleotide kinase family protein [Devosiaceae bacterium]
MTDSPQQLALAPDAALAVLVDHARALAAGGSGRVALGLAGGPGTGKSTLAAALVARLEAEAPGLAALVPMDGFHMRQQKLEALGIAAQKGAPHTFQGAAFADFLAALRSVTGAVSGPGYSRAIEDVVENAFTVPGETRLLVVEGNYLLLPEPPWERVRPLLDLAVFISLPRETVRERLLRRHAEHGLFSEERNRAHVDRVDLANYDHVAASRRYADIAIDLVTES